jgi:hypothetical protein
LFFALGNTVELELRLIRLALLCIKHGRMGTGTCITGSRVDTDKTSAYHDLGISNDKQSPLSVLSPACPPVSIVARKLDLISPSTQTHDHRLYLFLHPRPSSYKYSFPLPRVPVRLYDPAASPAEPNSEATNNVVQMHTRRLVTPSQQHSSIVVALSPTVLKDDIPSGPHNSKSAPGRGFPRDRGALWGL